MRSGLRGRERSRRQKTGEHLLHCACTCLASLIRIDILKPRQGQVMVSLGWSEAKPQETSANTDRSPNGAALFWIRSWRCRLLFDFFPRLIGCLRCLIRESPLRGLASMYGPVLGFRFAPPQANQNPPLAGLRSARPSQPLLRRNRLQPFFGPAKHILVPGTMKTQ